MSGKIVKVGSMKPDCHMVAKRIQEICSKWEIRLEMFWITRDSNQIKYCNQVSKEIDTSDYWLVLEEFCWLEKKFGLFVDDYFASSRSRRMFPFYARFGCSESMGVDVFSVSCGKGFGNFHPPVG